MNVIRKAEQGLWLNWFSYVEDSRDNSIPVFKLHDLKEMYENQLEQLGTAEVCYSTCLKDRLLEKVPSFSSYNKGRDVYLACKEDNGDAIHRSLLND